MRRGASVVLILLGLVLPAWSAEAPGARPEINRQYETPDFEQWVGVFERPGREVYDRRHEIVQAVGPWRGAAVADIGAGTGLFTRLFARAVGPEGKVYAVDISREFVRNIRRIARTEGLTNVEGIVNTQTDVRLPPNSIDIAFVCDTYHHFEQPKPTLASIQRALRPNGALVIVDFRRVEGQSSAWILEHIRADRRAVIREVEAAGFRFVEEKGFLRENYFLRFVRKD
jgi:ubiquinone/menaquinone biosynthesis C-methylase UbiE